MDDAHRDNRRKPARSPPQNLIPGHQARRDYAHGDLQTDESNNRPYPATRRAPRAPENSPLLGPNPQWQPPKRAPGQPKKEALPNSLDSFTLGDIRQAEAAMSAGMSMHEYANRVRTGNLPKSSAPASSGGFFVEEETEEFSGPRWGRSAAPRPAPGQVATNLLNLLSKAPAAPQVFPQPAMHAPQAPQGASPAGKRVDVKDLFSMAGQQPVLSNQQAKQLASLMKPAGISPAEMQAQQMALMANRRPPPPPPGPPPPRAPAPLPAELLAALQAQAKAGSPSPSDCQQS